MRKPFAIKTWIDYDTCKIFPTVESYIAYCKNEGFSPTRCVDGVYFVFEDLEEELIEVDYFLKNNIIQETIFDESLLEASGEAQENKSKEILANLTIPSGGFVTGSYFSSTSKEKWIENHKKANKYSWSN